MKEFKFYLTNNIDEDIELTNTTFPQKYTDVMDGSFDTGSVECIITYQEYYNYKDSRLREGEFIRKQTIENGVILDDTVFLIDEVNFEKDSVYDSNEISLTIKYEEATKYLITLMMSNHTCTVSPIVWPNAETSKLINSLWWCFEKSRIMLRERNNAFNLNVNDNTYRTFELDEEVVNIMKKYPYKNRTYLDSNFFDICKENFAVFSAVPYLNAKDRKLTYISSMGVDSGKKLEYDKDRIVVSSSYNRNMSNNADVIENKAVNIYEDYETVWYPNNIDLEHNSKYAKLATNYVRPKGYNEGLESYQEWYNWYIELPQNIERIDKLYYLNVSNIVTDEVTESSNSNEYMDVTDRIVEDSIYQGLTETEKKYYAHYKRGSNIIKGVAIASGLTTENDVWPWDRTSDNNVAFRAMFAVKYKPILNADITVVKNSNKLFNKKNIAIGNKNISDADLVSQTKYELDKNYYGQYMLEIASDDYYDFHAGDIVEIKEFEEYLVPTGKYIIYKIDSDIEKDGSHQILYFNEMIAKNNVLLNENNLVRISENTSEDSIIDRVCKNTDVVGLNLEFVDDDSEVGGNIFDTYATTQFIIDSLKAILTPQMYGFPYQDGLNYIKGSFVNVRHYHLGNNLNYKNEDDIVSLLGNVTYLNSGTVSQAIIRAMDNSVWDNKGVIELNKNNINFTESKPIKYTDLIGGAESIEVKFVNKNFFAPQEEFDENVNVYMNYYPENAIFVAIQPLVNMTFLNKDPRERFVGAYEETWCSNDSNLLLSDYFTSCSSLFDSGTTEQQIAIGKFDKDILVFDKKIYNVNSIDESEAIMKIEGNNYSQVFSWNVSNLYIDLEKLQGFGITKSIVIRGVSNSHYKKLDPDLDVIVGNYEYVSKFMVPQMVINIPEGTQSRYIKISMDAKKL